MVPQPSNHTVRPLECGGGSGVSDGMCGRGGIAPSTLLSAGGREWLVATAPSHPYRPLVRGRARPDAAVRAGGRDRAGGRGRAARAGHVSDGGLAGCGRAARGKDRQGLPNRVIAAGAQTARTRRAPRLRGGGTGAFDSGAAVRVGSVSSGLRPGTDHRRGQAACRTNWTSRLIVTSLPRVKPPASSAAFQFTPNSVRSIFVVASAPNLTWP